MPYVDVPAEGWEALGGSLVRRLAAVLPPDVRARDARGVPDDFDARFGALWRRYEYRVTDAPYGAEPLRRRDTLAWPSPLELYLLNAAAAGLTGEHDFAAYCKRKEHATTVRAISRLDGASSSDGAGGGDGPAAAASARPRTGELAASRRCWSGRASCRVDRPGWTAEPARTGQRGHGGVGARVDPGRRRLPGRPRQYVLRAALTRRLRA